MAFLDSISRYENVQSGDLYADDVILLASSDHDLQNTLRRFAVKMGQDSTLPIPRLWYSARKQSPKLPHLGGEQDAVPLNDMVVSYDVKQSDNDTWISR